ncbi:hypothetical protein CISIN_1g038983mg [Citrus sinensis]|uniref:Uncharacterized protein n=1 Tax=Citrus sinensis TaxID=2711 RepID=A0A067D1K5_CITSI|nr:hypothetical protein CISIN_1g038983mg [Citrus sinensis]
MVMLLIPPTTRCGNGRLAGSLTSRRRGWSRWRIGGETCDSETRDRETRLIGWRAATVTMLADLAAGWVAGLVA